MPDPTIQATLLAIRDVHKLLNVGVRESEAGAMMASAFSAAGLKNGGCLTLFGGKFMLIYLLLMLRTLSL